MKLFWPKNYQFEEAINQLKQQKTNTLFSEELLQFTQSLSKRLLKFRNIPEVVALGYWLRASNIKQIKQQFEQGNENKVIRARGIIFHIAPSNVDTIFVYSWILSLLAGNLNVIRISSKNEVNELLAIIIEEIEKSEAVANTTIICTYGRDENVNETLSSICHTRVVWGGNETVNTFRNIPLSPLANELAFPDRFSLAVLNSDVVNNLTVDELDQLLEKFYNDVFWFDQMACSSPRLVIWRGQCKVDFWGQFERKIIEKKHELVAATQVLKYTSNLRLAVENFVNKVNHKQYFSRVDMNSIPPEAREQHCGGGLFFETYVDEITDVASIIVDKDQTITYFGFNREELKEFTEQITSRAIDRIVPIGQALDFNNTWDGQSFMTSFTREIIIK